MRQFRAVLLMVVITVVGPRALAADCAPWSDANKAAESANAEEEALLSDAHGLTTQRSGTDRVQVLSTLVYNAGLMRSFSTPQWAFELFEATAVLAPALRANRQHMAISAAARVDLVAAMNLLDRMDEARDPYAKGEVAETAVEVFRRAYADKGAAVLPQLRELAQRLATRGDYPFLVWVTIVPDVAKSDPAQAEVLFKECLNAYRTAKPSFGVEWPFYYFFDTTHTSVPTVVAKDAVSAIAEHLIEANEATSEGNASPSPQDLAQARGWLKNRLPAMQGIDPALAESLKQRFPELSSGTSAEPVQATSARFHQTDMKRGPATPCDDDLAKKKLAAAEKRSEWNTRMADSARMKDPGQRAQSYALLAQAVSGPLGNAYYSEVSKLAGGAELLPRAVAGARQAAESVSASDAYSQFFAWTSVVRAAAAANDSATACEAVQRALPSGLKLLTSNPERYRDDGNFWEWARAGTEACPGLTRELIGTVSDVHLRAYMLFTSAMSLYKQRTKHVPE